MPRALLIIDIQNDYFPGGAFPLVGPEAAAEAAAGLLGAFRDRGEPVIHVRHLSPEPDATFMVPDTEGAEIHPAVAPADGEPVVEKGAPNSFLDTGLEDRLRAGGVDELVVVGMMSSMCVDATVRAAADLGFRVTVAHDGCAAPDLRFGNTHVPGESVHAAFMAALDGTYATVVDSEELVAP
jgi:nicotinamidase-related amidase